MEFAVEIKNLEKRFGNLFAIKKLSLDIEKGIIFGVVGPDGSGKSTLLKLMCGLLQADEGEIKILGTGVREGFNLLRKKIGYLSQEFNLYEDLTVDENIEFFGEIYKVKDWRERRERILKFTNLIHFRNRLAEKLSGGMKKKLALACTLIHEPEIFILDEPTLGIDPVSRMEIWKIIFQLSKRGLTVILSTSYLDEAERCSKVALMFVGNVIYSGDPENIKKKIGKKVLDLTVSDPLRAFEILKLNGYSENLNISGDRIRVSGMNLEEIEKRIEGILGASGIKIYQTRFQLPSFEDSFISILKEVKGE